MVQNILRTKYYYSMLGVQKGCGEDEIKKAYRKIALKLHPDKNHAPGSDEAFKKVSKAFSCLSDAQKRSSYDTYGDEEHVRGGGFHHRGGSDMDAAQEIFEAFFGGGMGHVHRQQYHHGHGVQQQNPMQFMVLLVMLLLFLGNFSSMTHNEPTFSFKPTSRLSQPRVTAGLGVKHFVAEAHDVTAKRNFDRTVEVYWIHHLRSECDYETQIQLKKLRKAKASGHDERIKAAQQMAKPACSELDGIKKKNPSIYQTALSWS